MTARALPTLVLACACTLLIAFAVRPARAEGPTLAIEDTMRTEVSEVLVKAPRVTLDEILDRVARGEARRDSLLQDQSFTAMMRVLGNTTGKGKPTLFVETVSKVYKKKPNLVRTITLRHYEYKSEKERMKEEQSGKKKEGDVNADFSSDMGEGIINFAFRPDNRRNFKFRIEDRKLLGDHLLYTLAFEPRSALAVHEPRGRVWVDTKDYVIVRQELSFKQSPVPLVLKSIPHMVVERTRAGEFWVLSRALIRMELTVPLPKFGRAFDFGMSFSDYAVNAGLPDSLFAPPGKGVAKNRVSIRVGSRR